MMSGPFNYGSSFDNYGNPRTSYDVPQPHNAHLVFDDNRVVFEEDRPVANSYPTRVVFEERNSVPLHRNHRHGSKEPRKQVHFVEHEERVTEFVDSNGNRKVHKESVDNEADGFIQRKHKNFELNKFGTFNSYY
ncbi:hypothetical protein L6452_07241 [Arctium lappa]|uniref:Uncharacterized protein n=1 Tax=Arctium lappa TaxID=4217 RepID=A0ACB9ELU0_ARCLA|nr:hypothetical protein L6452_07241 [Arctium lappa]